MTNANNLALKTLLDIASKDRFAIVDGPFGTQLHASEYTEDGVPVIRVVNTSYSGRFLNENIVFVSATKAEQLRRSKVVPGDIVVAKTGATIGKSGIFPDCYTSGIIASSCIKLAVDESVADKQFVAYLIQSHDGQNKIIDAAGGSTRTTINTKPFGAISFLFPSKPEQTKIAEVLSTLDRAIEQTEALIAKQQRIKTGLMQDLLTKGIDGHGNIRSEATHAFKDSPLGRIPVEWDVEAIEVMLDKIIDYRGRTPTKVESGVPLLTAKNVRDGFLDEEPREFIAEEGYEKWMTRGIPVIGDVLFTTEAPMGNVARVPDYRIALAQRLLTLCPKPGKLTQDYLFWLLHWGRTTERLELLTSGSTVTGVKQSVFRKVLFKFPKEDEQERITRCLNSNASTSDSEKKTLAKLQSLKRGLMHDLLTAKRRVTPLLEPAAAQ